MNNFAIDIDNGFFVIQHPVRDSETGVVIDPTAVPVTVAWFLMQGDAVKWVCNNAGQGLAFDVRGRGRLVYTSEPDGIPAALPAFSVCELCGERPGIRDFLNMDGPMDVLWLCAGCELEERARQLPFYDEVYGPLVSGGAS